MKLPNFLIVGAAKSGTTALYRYIKQHPNIYMPSRKEPHYFSFTEKTKQTNGPGDYVRTAITDFHQYQSLFNNADSFPAVGEASPTYLYIPGTAERIYSIIPDTKIIAILRHPAERAFSAYMHLVRDGYEKSLDFEDALAKESERIKQNWGPIWHYTKSGYYYEQLERYYEIFNHQKIKVIIYDDFKKHPEDVIKSIFKFLEINEFFEPDMSAKPNVSGLPRSKFAQSVISYFFDHDNPIRNLSRVIFPEEVRWKFTSNIRNNNLLHHSLSLETRHNLIDLFHDDILKLQNLINCDLSNWLKK